ncbi:MAG: AAA family ATPase, partial [Clostridia bacterium]|nr:AAA family ATPase [Clostridia bacterium]
MDLFRAAGERQRKKEAPLADRMRPKTLDEFAGQEEILGPGKLLRRSIEADRLGSMILFRPPGAGKTSLALLIARYTQARFERLNAVTAGVAEVRKLIQEAEERLALYGQKTVVFLDEIHRFNKAQQDALLPAVEDGTILLIGATTENPYYHLNAPLLSRCRLFRLSPLKREDVEAIVRRALADRENGLGEYKVELTAGAM